MPPIHTTEEEKTTAATTTAAAAEKFKYSTALEFPFATKEKGEIVFNSIRVDPPINTSRTTKDLRLEEKIIRAKITAIDARSLRSAVVGLIDSVALVVETVERCER